MLTFPTSAGEYLAASSWGAGPPVILLHAGGERRGVWDPIGPTVANTGRRVVAVDQRGHGASSPAPVDRLEGFIDDVGGVLRSLGEPAALVGASLGGFAALGASARWPRSVTAIALVDVVPDLDPVVVSSYLAVAANGRFADTPLVNDILGRVDDLRKWAVGFGGPLLLVRGADSHLSPELADQLCELCPKLIVETVEGAGHLVAQDQPHRLAELLCSFLRPPSQPAADRVRA